MGKTFVTSNLQLGRPGAIKKYGRNHASVDEMDADLIKTWNTVVTKDDTVYHLGNFAWDPRTAQSAMLALNGKIKFSLGEHDEAIELLDKKGMLRPGCEIVKCIETDKDNEAVLSYWPLNYWPNKPKKWYSIIGFPQKSFKSDPKKKVINASADFWSYKPQELQKLMGIFNDF
jgi:calcineurin-like phosphoesterase family protein